MNGRVNNVWVEKLVAERCKLPVEFVKDIASQFAQLHNH